ncbi:MAG: hypothetical protein R3Y63_09820 [Eubacteriales bacterium]
MEKEIHDKQKLVAYWLTREESTDPKLEEQIKEEAKIYKEKKYKVAVFHSGKEPLYDHALALLKHNLRSTKPHERVPVNL